MADTEMKEREPSPAPIDTPAPSPSLYIKNLNEKIKLEGICLDTMPARNESSSKASFSHKECIKGMELTSFMSILATISPEKVVEGALWTVRRGAQYRGSWQHQDAWASVCDL